MLRHLPSADFIAIDEEMTGISIPGSPRPRKDRTPTERFDELRQPPERYSIIQLGVSLFETNGAEWKVRRYNFYMFPHASSNDPWTREVVLNPSSIAFLHQHGMSLDLWSRQGIGYHTAQGAAAKLQAYLETERQRLEEEQVRPAPTMAQTLERKVELRRPEDIDFYARTMASLREWLDVAHEGLADGRTFLLPACNSFLRRALYENIAAEYPQLILEKADDAPNQIRVWRLNEEERRQRSEEQRQQAWHDLMFEVGMYRVFAALSAACKGEGLDPHAALWSDSYQSVSLDLPPMASSESTGRPKPLIVHNGLMDLLFLMTHFHDHALPDDLPSTKAQVRQYFPIVYDTKVLSLECSTLWNNEQTNLANLFQKIVLDSGLLSRIDVVEDTEDGEVAEDQEHEAAYDAYMTGCVFIGLCEHIQEFQPVNTNGPALAVLTDSDEQLRSGYARNMLYQLSMFTLDLESGQDPLKRGLGLTSSYRVSGIDPSITTRDIVRCVNELYDDSMRRINFDIVWVDSTTFIIAARYRPEHRRVALHANGVYNESTAKTLQVHGWLVLDAIRRRFATEDICTMEEYFERLAAAKKGAPQGWLSRMLQWVGLKRKPEDAGEDDDRPAKRRRTS